GAYSVIANENQPLTFEETTNGPHVFLHFNFSPDVNSVRIEGTEAIPEFPSWTPAVAAVAMLVVIVAAYNQRANKKREIKVRQ
ncbi:MAG: hypothetical protein WC325_12345, partial [Candidatus Bathyarchaeia archaeon]